MNSLLDLSRSPDPESGIDLNTFDPMATPVIEGGEEGKKKEEGTEVPLTIPTTDPIDCDCAGVCLGCNRE